MTEDNERILKLLILVSGKFFETITEIVAKEDNNFLLKQIQEVSYRMRLFCQEMERIPTRP